MDKDYYDDDDDDDDYESQKKQEQTAERERLYSDFVLALIEELSKLYEEQPELFKPGKYQALYQEVFRRGRGIIASAEYLFGYQEIENAFEQACENVWPIKA